MIEREKRTIVFFPEASFGSALNCVGIAQELRRMGYEPIFITHLGFTGVFSEYGFREFEVQIEREMTDEENSLYWEEFLSHHLPHFNLAARDQIDTYVAPIWQAIVDTAKSCEPGLRRLLARLKPDLVVLDNVIMFPAIANLGCPWVRIISCAETEIPDENVPPCFSGLPVADINACEAFSKHYLSSLESIHDGYNAFRATCGLEPLDAGLFLEESPYLNLLLAPSILRHARKRDLPGDRFAFLEGCVRTDMPFEVPGFQSNDGPLVYSSFGSLGSLDTDYMRSMIEIYGGFPARFLVNVGPQIEQYSNVPDNVHLSEWFPEPSVLPHCDLFIHHGGNNSFCEALFFGLPSLIIPYAWDGHDNALRAEQTGVGHRILRMECSEKSIHDMLQKLLNDRDMKKRLRDNAKLMRAHMGTNQAATRIAQELGDT